MHFFLRKITGYWPPFWLAHKLVVAQFIGLTILQLGQPNKLGDHKLNQNTMRNYFLPIFFLAATTALSAQSYVTAGGIRLGTEWGLTFKQRVLEHTTVEGILQQSFQRKEFTVTGLAAQHYPVLLNGLNFYFGGGLHKGWNNQPKTFENPDGFKDPFGITAIGGLELTLGRLNLSYDYKPALNLVGGERTFYMQTGLSARYVFYSNRDLKKKERAKKKQTRKEKIRKKLRFWEKD